MTLGLALIPLFILLVAVEYHSISNMGYTSDELRSIRDFVLPQNPLLPMRTLHRIRELDINVIPATKRGRSAGRNNGLPIPVRVTPHRPYRDNSRAVVHHNLTQVRLLNGNATTKTLRCGFLNAQSCRNKINTVKDYISSNDLDFLVIIESWFFPKDTVKKGKLKPDGYSH